MTPVQTQTGTPSEGMPEVVLISSPEPEKKPAKPKLSAKEPEPKYESKPWHRTARLAKVVQNSQSGLTQLNLTYRDYKTDSLKLWTVVIPATLKGKVAELREGDYITVYSIGNSVTDVVKKVFEEKHKNSGRSNPTITFASTINLQNYENLRVEVTGEYESQEDIERLKEDLKSQILTFGKDDVTREMVTKYVKRVFG